MQNLDAVQKDVDNLKACCSGMEERLAQTKVNAGRLIAKAEELQTEK